MIRASICTGELVAGFQDLYTVKFEDVMLLKTETDLLDTLKANREICVGMAANMIGVNKSITVMEL